MAKTKQKSAAQRREQVRQQRQQSERQSQRQSERQPVQSAPRQQTQTRKVRRTARRSINPWWFIGGILVVLAIIVGIFIYISNQQGNVTTSSTTDPTVLQEVTHVNPSLLSQVGTGSVKNPFQAPQHAQPILTGPNGKPQFFYYGAEYCPYCAAQRWGVVVALSRFGTFTQLPEIASSSTDAYPNTATFSFYHSSYSSSYIDFVPIEAEDGQGQPLQALTPDQQQIVNTYDNPPYTSQQGFPFIDVANQYLANGPAFVPDVLAGLSQKEIASALSSTDSDASRNIMATANYLTASICAVTKNQPANVCGDGYIQSIEQSLPKAKAYGNGSQVANISGQLEMVIPEQTRRRG